MKIKPDSPKPPSKELRRFVDEFLNDTLSRSDFARFEELLENDEEARRYYLEIAGNEALIPLALDGKKRTARLARNRRKGIARPLLAIAAVAALVLGIAFLLPKNTDDSTNAPSQNFDVAVTGAIGVDWSHGGTPEIDHPLPQGFADISVGLLELTYANGVRVILEGPARYQVSGANAGRLDYGNLVAEVPPGAEGFTVDYGIDRLVDHGTQFGVRFPKGSTSPEIAVFRGEVEVFPGRGEDSARLFRDHAVRRSSKEKTGLQSIPLDRSLYTRELPSRELPWEMPPVPVGNSVSLDFDISNLIWKADDYRFVFKWMQGHNAVHLDGVELRLNGKKIASDAHTGLTGNVEHTEDNIFSIKIDPAQFEKGLWTLHTTLRCYISSRFNPTDPKISDSMGILLVEQGLANSAKAEDFIGTWDYWHNGVQWSREILPDGKAILHVKGQVHRRPTWSFKNGVVSMYFPSENITEEVLLRDRETLIFVDRPFRNALKQ